MRAKRSLGQNFLVSRRVAQDIAAACRELLPWACAILEIGPGHGALTGELALLGMPLVLIEKDDLLARSLAESLPAATVLNADVLEIDLDGLLRSEGPGARLVVGNLPYNQGTAIVKRFLRSPERVAGLVFMLQAEVVQKLCAVENEEGYGPLAVLSRTWWRPERLLRVPPGAFSPAPKVTSAVVRLVPLASPFLDVRRFDEFARFVDACFKAPRKLLAANVSVLIHDKNLVAKMIEAAGIELKSRPADVSPEAFARLYLSMARIAKEE